MSRSNRPIPEPVCDQPEYSRVSPTLGIPSRIGARRGRVTATTTRARALGRYRPQCRRSVRVRGQPHDGRTGGVCCSWGLSEGRPIIAVRPPEARRSKRRNAAARPSRPRRASLRLRHWRRLVRAAPRGIAMAQLGDLVRAKAPCKERRAFAPCRCLSRVGHNREIIEISTA